MKQTNRIVCVCLWNTFAGKFIWPCKDEKKKRLATFGDIFCLGRICTSQLSLMYANERGKMEKVVLFLLLLKTFLSSLSFYSFSFSSSSSPFFLNQAKTTKHNLNFFPSSATAKIKRDVQFCAFNYWLAIFSFSHFCSLYYHTLNC